MHPDLARRATADSYHELLESGERRRASRALLAGRRRTTQTSGDVPPKETRAGTRHLGWIRALISSAVHDHATGPQDHGRAHIHSKEDNLA